MKHSKGEWYFDYEDQEIQVGSGFPIAAIYNADGEEEANAKLIAAAPDMLEALQSAINVSDLWMPADSVITEFEGEAMMLAAMKLQFETVIKKATS